MTLRRLVLLLPCLLAVAAIVPRPVAAQGVVADLSDHLIAITTAFSGTDVLLFGALDEAGTDVAVVVRGPETDEIVRHKTRVGPIWLNTGEMTFAKAPSYYAVASSKPLEELADPGELRRHGIGTHNLGFERMASPRASPGEVRPFVDALIRNYADSGWVAKEQQRLIAAIDRAADDTA